MQRDPELSPGEPRAPLEAFLHAKGRVLTALELEDLQRANMLRALEEAGWKVAGPGGAAERLGLRPNTLASRMKALGLRRPGPNDRSALA